MSGELRAAGEHAMLLQLPRRTGPNVVEHLAGATTFADDRGQVPSRPLKIDQFASEKTHRDVAARTDAQFAAVRI
jgi:hypothetical protein